MTAIANLYCRYKYRSQGGQPILVVLHGWGEDALSLPEVDASRLCDYGFFLAVVGLRGRNGATGARDASAREIYDIYDVLTYIRATYPDVVSSTKAGVVGYSGGGGNALAFACKFPDAATVIVSHFGTSDYGRSDPDGWYYNNGGANTAGIVASVGDTPTNVPNNYYARDATAAIQNFTGGKLYLYHDKQDTSVPWVHSNRIKAAMDAAGLNNYSANFSDVGDSPRWLHGFPNTNPNTLSQAEPTWTADILSREAWTIPASGTVTVIGYIVTKRFTVWLGTGLTDAATVAYNTATDTYTVTPLTTAPVNVTITQGAKTGGATGITGATEIVVA